MSGSNSATSLLAASVVALAACGSDTAGGGSARPTIVGDYDLPTVGTVHTYATGGSTQTFEVIASSANGYSIRVKDAAGSTLSEGDYRVVDGGIYTATSRTYSGSLISTTYAPVSVLLPADVTPGTTETTVSTATIGSATHTLTRAATVDGLETVTVPYGTLEALKVTTLIDDSRTGVSNTYVVWWGAGVGRVKMVAHPTSTPASATTWELTSVTGPYEAGSLDGTYDTTVIRCNGTAAPSPIADLITGGNSMSFLVSGTSGSITWSDGACTIAQPVAYSFPEAGKVTLTVAGAFTCAPSALACATLSTSTFGGGVCGQTDLQGPRAYTFSPRSVSSGETVGLLRVGGDECWSLAGATDPISYVLTKR